MQIKLFTQKYFNIEEFIHCNALKYSIIILALQLFNTSCGIKKTASTKLPVVRMDTIKVNPNSGTNIFRSTPSKLAEIPTCTIYASFNWEAHELLGKVDMQVKPYNKQKLDTLSLDAQSMEIYSVMQDGQPCNFVYKKNNLQIALASPISGLNTSNIQIEYKAMPDKKVLGGSAAIRSDKGLYFTNTNKKDINKPTQLFTQGETESNSCWFPTIDKPGNKSIYTLHITVNNKLTTLSNGELIKQINNGDMRTDVWQCKKPMSAYLVMMAIGEYAMQKDSLGNLPVNYYVEPAYAKSAKAIFNNTPEMIATFSEKLGVPYPWEKYSQITARDYVSGAMENTSASLFGEFVQKTDRELLDNDNDGIVAHELFHQWFGDLVTCESWSNLTLNEGFATFGEHLWMEKKYSKEAQEELQYSDLQAYLRFAKTNDDPLINFYYNKQEDMFNRITYKKGGRVLHLLRSELGADVFFEGLQIYLTKHAYRTAEVDDLRQAFEQASGKDLRPFFNQWFLRGSHPNIVFSYKRPDSNTLQISYVQQNDSANYVFDIPMQIKAFKNGKSVLEKYRINKKEGELIMDITELQITDNKEIPLMVIDADHTYIGTFTELKDAKANELVFVNTTSYTDKMRAMQAVYDKGWSPSVDAVFYSGLQDKLKLIRENALQSIIMDSITDREKLKGYLINIAKTDTYKPNVALALEHLGYYKDNNLKDLFLQNILDSNYNVASSALSAVGIIDTNLALSKAEWLLKNTTVRSRLKTAIANLYMRTGDNKYYDYLRQGIETSFGRERSQLMNALYVWSNNNKMSYEKVIDQLAYYATWDEVDNIKITGTRLLNSYLEYFKEKATSLNNTKELALLVEQRLKDIYALEQEESILKEYRKRKWIQ